ncbi:hypothetical protein GCM10011380_08990 [Sphingomonas metalli]|uniref:Uncharacterized protein n=1 Tax=Sphingomonas metalli TaxID=1779358 RepID=A0A916SY38_9SPHN|nr:hypothetical protein GCM10011380_08990 [Sphingomonas metalli]
MRAAFALRVAALSRAIAAIARRWADADTWTDTLTWKDAE